VSIMGPVSAGSRTAQPEQEVCHVAIRIGAVDIQPHDVIINEIVVAVFLDSITLFHTVDDTPIRRDQVPRAGLGPADGCAVRSSRQVDPISRVPERTHTANIRTDEIAGNVVARRVARAGENLNAIALVCSGLVGGPIARNQVTLRAAEGKIRVQQSPDRVVDGAVVEKDPVKRVPQPLFAGLIGADEIACYTVRGAAHDVDSILSVSGDNVSIGTEVTAY